MRTNVKYGLLIAFVISASTIVAQNGANVVETFDGGVELQSYSNEDAEPDAWELSAERVFTGSGYSLKLFGNTWKRENIGNYPVDSATVWKIAVYVEQKSEIQGFGVGDGNNALFYSFFGTEEVEFENWVTVYQGAFPENNWIEVYLPIGEDWLSEFGYLPVLDELIFINDKDETFFGSIYFDEIIDVTSVLPVEPVVSIRYTTGKISGKSVDVHFFSEVFDPDSEQWQYFWDFGDGFTSEEANPEHLFTVEDNHDYTVLLTVVDESGNTASSSCKIRTDEGGGTLPLTVNFTGDIMLARGMSYIIDYDGIETIFNPTKRFFGDDADISVANLECPLTDATVSHPTKPIYFKGLPEYADGLVYAGIDAVTLANNHIYDYLDAGLTETVNVLNNRGIANFGAGTNEYFARKPAFVSRKGISVAFVGASDRTGQYNNYQPYLNAGFNKAGFAEISEYGIIEQIERADAADLVVFQMHSGREYSTEPRKCENGEDEFYNSDLFSPSKNDIAIRRFAIDAGADAVICHHPHIAQGFEVYKGKLIAHSLGNFVFDMGYSETLWSVILKGYANQNEFTEYEITPVYIENYIPRRLKGETGLYWLNELAEMSRKLNAYVAVNNDSVKGKIILDSSSIVTDVLRFEKELEFSESEGVYYSKPLKLNKRGSVTKILAAGRTSDFEYRLGREKLWYGNMEDEGAQPWEFNHSDEFYDENEFASGTRSLCQRRPSNRLPLNTCLLKRIKIYNPQKEFTLHAFVKTENAKNAGVQILIYDSRYSDYSLATFELDEEISGNKDWKEYFGDFQPPENGEFFNLRLRSESPDFGEGFAWFDNVGVIEWDEWQSSENANEIDYPNNYYWIQIRKTVAESSETLVYEETALNENAVHANEIDNLPPERIFLSQNYPNPFNPSTTIKYSVPSFVASKRNERGGMSNNLRNNRHAANVRLIVYDILGREVATLVNEKQTPGNYSVKFNAGNLSSGVYIYMLQSGEYSVAKKMILLK